MQTSSILVLCSIAEAAAPVADALRAVGYEVTVVSDADEAVRRAGEFTLVTIDAVDPPRTGVDVCSEIRRTPTLAAIPVLCICQDDDVEERVRFLEAGADDVIARPFDARELQARVEGLLVRFRRSRDLAPQASVEPAVTGRRHLVACFSPKGGVGTTMIAVNLATALAERAPDQVAILDLDVDFGQVATHLNVKPRLTVADLAGDEMATRDADLLRSYAEQTRSGLHVIAAPVRPDLGRSVTPEQVGRILATAQAAYQVVVVDAGSTLDERALVILDMADAVILPIVPEIGALKALHGLMEFLAEDGSVPAKSTYVLNHLFARDVLSMKQIETAIGARVDLELPHDVALYLKAVNEGIPVVTGAPASAPARALVHLMSTVTGVEEAGPAVKRGGLFGGILRRT